MDEPPRDIRLIERRASARADSSQSGIGAAVVQQLADDDPEHTHFRVRLSDGRLFGWVEVVMRRGLLEEGEVENAVEHTALDLPRDGRLLALEDRSPLLIR